MWITSLAITAIFGGCRSKADDDDRFRLATEPLYSSLFRLQADLKTGAPQGQFASDMAAHLTVGDAWGRHINAADRSRLAYRDLVNASVAFGEVERFPWSDRWRAARRAMVLLHDARDEMDHGD